MGWIMSTRNRAKKRIYTCSKNNNVYDFYTDEGGSSSVNSDYWAWRTGGQWDSSDVCILFYNDSNAYRSLNSATLGTLSCNSGGKSFWAWSGQKPASSAQGIGGQYSAWVEIFHLSRAGKSYSQSALATTISDIRANHSDCIEASTVGSGITIPAQPDNLIYAGSSKTKTAVFGYNKQSGRYLETTFNITDCPVIEPGDLCFCHLRIIQFSGSASNATVMFNLGADDVPVEEAPVKGYVWQYQADNKWHLVKPIYVATSNTAWSSVDGT